MEGTLSVQQDFSPSTPLPFPKRFGQVVERILQPHTVISLTAASQPLPTNSQKLLLVNMMGVAFVVGSPDVQAPNLEWLKPLFQTTSELLTLPKNWDSYGSNPVNPFSISNAVTLVLSVINQNIPKPSIVPTSEGNVQLEWHIRGIDLEIEVKPNNKMFLSFEDEINKESFEEVFDFSNNAIFLKAIAKLSKKA